MERRTPQTGASTARGSGAERPELDRRTEERLLAEVREELHDSTARFRLAWEHSPIGMTMVSLDGDWLDVNDALCRLLGRPREELLGRVVERVTHPDDLDMSIERMDGLIAEGSGAYTIGKRYLHADGTPVEVQLTVTAIPDRDGQPDYVLAQIVDLTEIRRVEAQLRRTVADLERSNRTLEAFAEVVSHDLTSPLGTAQALVDTVLRHHRDELPGRAEFLLLRADRQAQRALLTARTLLQLAMRGPAEHEPESIDLGELAGEVIDGFEHELRDAGARVEVGPVSPVFADPAQLQLVLQNLLANALKYRAPDRDLEVRVHCEERPGEVAIHVDDNGRGIEHVADPALLLEAGSRGHDDPAIEGLGLGLATCSRIAAAHGGQLSVRPLEPVGTRVSVVLPTG